MNTRNLTAKQRRFVEGYLIDLNATQAAIRAGYSEKTAGQVGFENLKKPQIRAEIVGLLRLSIGLFVTQHTINLRYRAKCSMG